jgi:hypothetical protein
MRTPRAEAARPRRRPGPRRNCSNCPRLCPSDNEAHTEEDLIRPILRVLGHTFEVQPALKTLDGTKKPDYVFYRDLAALNANKYRTLDEGLLQGKAFAVGDAKYWERPLDQNLKRANADPFTKETRPIRSRSLSSTAVWNGASQGNHMKAYWSKIPHL